MAYTRVNWENAPSTNTPRNATNLNVMDEGLFNQDARITVNETEIDNLQTGWNSAGETWAYASVDDPTGVITIAGDKTGKYSLGMRIKFTNGGNTIYGIITKISYSSPNTTLTFLHEINPTTSLALHLMANSAITNNYYSNMKAPFGFPLNPNKWSVKVTDSGTIRQQLLATENVWYELTTATRLIIPIGLFIPKYSVKGQVNTSVAGSNTILVTLSTSSATESSAENTVSTNGSTASTGSSQYFEKTLLPLDLSSKTTYYLNTKGQIGAGTQDIYNRADDCATVISALCAYL